MRGWQYKVRFGFLRIESDHSLVPANNFCFAQEGLKLSWLGNSADRNRITDRQMGKGRILGSHKNSG
jgi:hypothetical protein